MPMLDIGGIKVDFPFEPYESQMIYMEKVITSLETKQNAMLESPTGTGKTLCLLCASLAWLNYKRKQAPMVKIENAVWKTKGNVVDDDISMVEEKLKIIYASRTHSQLKQVVNELKSTSYQPNIAVLGSREQLCVHEKVSKYKGTVQSNMCQALVQQRSCVYKFGSDEILKKKSRLKAEIMDIEELASSLEKKKCCPFYISRSMQADADIIFVPYNYLIDPAVRSSLEVSLANAVLIFDEAHNVESVASDAASFDISSIDIASCLKEIDKCLEVITGPDYSQDPESMLNPQSVATLKTLFLEVENSLSKIHWPGNENGVAKPGDYIYEFFRQFNITSNTFPIIHKMLTQTIEMLCSELDYSLRSSKVEYFARCLRTVFIKNEGQDGKLSTDNYKVFIHETKEKNTSNRRKSFTELGRITNPRVLSYWCFCPGVSFKEIERANPHNIILTSGTLSPLESTASELEIDFNIRLENSHVIDSSQVWVGVVPTGVTGKKLNSGYQNRNSSEYKSELGNTIANFARIIPKGLLVFFPSYSNMEECLQHWQHDGSWSRITKQKDPFVEPRGSGDFKQIVDSYEQCIKQSVAGGILFAVCRGKVSEGIDFRNDNGRAVVITGLPFAPTKDPRIVLKRAYMDNSLSKHPNSSKISGNAWYVQEATRAVNQAIGRVIRHRNDYGAIILCDERFGNPQQQRGLSKWVQPCYKVCKSYGEANIGLIKFFKKNGSNFNLSSISHSQKEILSYEDNDNIESSCINKMEKQETKNSFQFQYAKEEENFSDMIQTGLTYVNPELLKQKEEKIVEEVLLKEVASKVNFSEFLARRAADDSPKALTLESVYESTHSRIESHRISTKSMTRIPLSEKYKTDEENEIMIKAKKAAKSFGLGKTNNLKNEKNLNSVAARNILDLARNLLSSQDAKELFNLLKALKSSSSPQIEMKQICQLLNDPLHYQLLVQLMSFFNSFQLTLFKNTLKSMGIVLSSIDLDATVNQMDKKFRANIKQKEDSKKRHHNSVEIEELLQCLVCLENIPLAFAAPCGHLCCRECWRKINKRSIELNCPVCKTKFEISALQKVKRTKSEEIKE